MVMGWHRGVPMRQHRKWAVTALLAGIGLVLAQALLRGELPAFY